MKRNIIVIILIFTCLSFAAVQGTFAYFTSGHSQTNTFTTGAGVEIELTQPSLQQASFALYPREEIKQDPTIKALQEDAWVRIRVEISDGGVALDEVKSSLIWDMIDFNLTDFALDEVYSQSTEGVRYYNYGRILRQGEEKTLFTRVKIPYDLDEYLAAELGSFTLLVSAEAIQARGFENDDERAFRILHGNGSKSK